MKIAITGVTGFRNRGVEALVQPTVEQLLARYPAAHITIATWSPEYDQTRLSHPQVEFVEDCYLRNGLWAEPETTIPCGPLPLWRRALRKGMRILNGGKLAQPQDPVPLSMPFGIPDLVVISGGDLISSDYGTASLAHFLKPVHWASAHGIPCALIGQSIGRFRNEEDIRLWQAAECAASLVTVREPLSRTYLLKELGSPPDSIVQVADSAFLLEPEPRLDAALQHSRSRLVVGLSISNVISKLRGQDPSHHLAAWEKLIRHIVQQWGATVRIIPHVQESYTDDRITSTEIWRRMGYDPGVEILAADLSASEYKATLKNCDLVIAERMHAAIGAISTGVPTVVIGYSIKARGIIKQVFDGTAVDPESMVMDLEDFLMMDQAFPRLDHAWQQRATISATIRARLPEIKELAMLNFQRIRRLFPA